MFLLPWFLTYGASSWPFSHPGYAAPQWTLRVDRPYELDAPPGADLRRLCGQVLADLGLTGVCSANRLPNGRQINIYRPNFLHPTRITYYIDQKRLTLEDRGLLWPQFLTSLHARGGFEHDDVLQDAWGLTVDIVCVGMILWIATGLYMWWQLPSCRAWGWLALAGGAGSFALFMARL
jgi:hypothetical protein